MSIRAEIKEILLSKTEEEDPKTAQERVKDALLRLADELDAINAKLGATD